MFLKAVTLLAVAATSLATPISNASRDPKSLSLFAVVSFPNDQCTSTDDATTLGTCLSATECSDKGGTNDGNCAAGFGICCTFKLTGCGGDVNNNCTYLQNEGWPSAYTTVSKTCTYKIKTVKDDICQLRLDFTKLDVPITAATGACDGSLQVVSPTGKNPSNLCGILDGQHIYVDVDSSSTDTEVKVLTGTAATSVSRFWKIKTSQIECTSMSRAPKDCTQFFTGIAGIIQSPNFNAATQLIPQNLEMAICFRQEMGYCGVRLAEDSGITAPQDAFFLRISIAIATANDIDTLACTIGRINIPFFPTTGMLCGGIFGTTEAQGTPEVVDIAQPPLIFHYISAGSVVSSTGYSLAYTLTPC